MADGTSNYIAKHGIDIAVGLDGQSKQRLMTDLMDLMKDANKKTEQEFVKGLVDAMSAAFKAVGKQSPFNFSDIISVEGLGKQLAKEILKGAVIGGQDAAAVAKKIQEQITKNEIEIQTAEKRYKKKRYLRKVSDPNEAVDVAPYQFKSKDPHQWQSEADDILEDFNKAKNAAMDAEEALKKAQKALANGKDQQLDVSEINKLTDIVKNAQNNVFEAIEDMLKKAKTVHQVMAKVFDGTSEQYFSEEFREFDLDSDYIDEVISEHSEFIEAWFEKEQNHFKNTVNKFKKQNKQLQAQLALIDGADTSGDKRVVESINKHRNSKGKVSSKYTKQISGALNYDLDENKNNDTLFSLQKDYLGAEAGSEEQYIAVLKFVKAYKQYVAKHGEKGERFKNNKTAEIYKEAMQIYEDAEQFLRNVMVAIEQDESGKSVGQRKGKTKAATVPSNDALSPMVSTSDDSADEQVQNAQAVTAAYEEQNEVLQENASLKKGTQTIEATDVADAVVVEANAQRQITEELGKQKKILLYHRTDGEFDPTLVGGESGDGIRNIKQTLYEGFGGFGDGTFASTLAGAKSLWEKATEGDEQFFEFDASDLNLYAAESVEHAEKLRTFLMNIQRVVGDGSPFDDINDEFMNQEIDVLNEDQLYQEAKMLFENFNMTREEFHMWIENAQNESQKLHEMLKKGETPEDTHNFGTRWMKNLGYGGVLNDFPDDPEYSGDYQGSVVYDLDPSKVKQVFKNKDEYLKYIQAQIAAHQQNSTAIQQETDTQVQANDAEIESNNKKIKSYEELSAAISRYIELAKTLVETQKMTPEHQQIQSDMRAIDTWDMNEQGDYIAEINAWQKNIAKIKAAMKAGASTYTNEDGYVEQITDDSLARAESKLRGYIYRYVEEFDDIDALLAGAKTKALQNIITKEVAKFKADEDIQRQQQEIADAANMAALAEMESIEELILNSASKGKGLSAWDKLIELKHRPKDVDRYTQSSQTDSIARDLDIVSPHVEIANNAKAIKSYESLCSVVERYNELSKKRYMFTGGEHPTLNEDEENEFAYLSGRLKNTSEGVDIHKFTKFGKIEDINGLAQALGIEIPQAAEKARTAVAGVESAVTNVIADDTTEAPVTVKVTPVVDDGAVARVVQENEVETPAVVSVTPTMDENAVASVVDDKSKQPTGRTGVSISEDRLRGILGEITYSVKITGGEAESNKLAIDPESLQAAIQAIVDSVKSGEQTDQTSVDVTNAPWALEATLKGETNARLDSIINAIKNIKVIAPKGSGDAGEEPARAVNKSPAPTPEVLSEEKKFLADVQRYYNLQLELAKHKDNKPYVAEIEKELEKLQEVKTTLDKIKDTEQETEKIKKARVEYEQNLAKVIGEQAKAAEKQADTLANKSRQKAKFGTVETVLGKSGNTLAEIEKLGTTDNSQVQEFISSLERLKKIYNELYKKDGVITDEEIAKLADAKNQTEEYRKTVERLLKQMELGNGEQDTGRFVSGDSTTYYDQLKKIAAELTNGKAKIAGFKQETNTLTYTVKTGTKEISTFTLQVRDLDHGVTKAGGSVKTFTTFFDGIKRKLKEVSQYVMGSSPVYQLIAELRKGIQYVREIDLALTELKKVTDETDETYDKFLKTAAKTGEKLGSTISAVTEATATFAKLGYNIEQASEMAEAALVYKNVGDGIASAEDAADSIISTLKGFGMEAFEAMEIVDRFNEVGNRFAITSKGIGEALRLSASALNEGGNSLDESIALITAANEVVNDPSSVGTALKTLTLRLRGSKTELEEMGEDVSDMATTTSQLQAKLLALTGGKVDIMLDANTFKNSTQILREMAEAWEDMTDIQRAEWCPYVQKCA